jgi:GntR family transcriptional repressor for pyruvate dehydrogenase complex
MFQDITRSKLHERVVEMITDRILAGDLGPGDALPPETELCQQFGVSRTVIREAIKMLQARGLVEVVQGRGTLVNPNLSKTFSEVLGMVLRQQQTTLMELWEVRRMLEVEIAGVAAERATEEDLREMKQALELMSSKPGEVEGYVDADIAFHDALTRAVHNSVLNLMLHSVGQLLRRSRRISFRGPERTAVTLAAHRAIYEAVAARDVQAAREAMRRHLDETAADLRAALGQDMPLYSIPHHVRYPDESTEAGQKRFTKETEAWQ